MRKRGLGHQIYFLVPEYLTFNMKRMLTYPKGTKVFKNSAANPESLFEVYLCSCTEEFSDVPTYDVWHFFQFRKRKDRSDAYEVCCWLKGYQGLHWIEWDEKMFDNIQQYLSSGQQIVARDRSQLPPSLYSAWDHKKIIPWTTRQEVDKVNFSKYNLTSTGRRRCPNHIRI